MAKKTFINATHLEGYVYEHKLELKTSGPNSKNPGTEFISGTLSIATDDEMLNVVPVHYTYVTATTSKNAPNQTYTALKAIIDGKIPNAMEHGKENAGKVRIDSALDLNEWYDSRQDDQLVSQKRNEGGFVHQTNELNAPNARATFNVDMVITGANRVEANEERNTPEKVVLKGYIFNFRGEVLPYDFSVLNPKAMEYFEDLGASGKNPVFTRIQGEQKSQTVERTITEEGAFGEPMVRTTKSSYRDFVVNWAQAEPYAWDDESSILASELDEKLKARELHLAEIKQRRDEYQASKNVPASTSTKDYNF